MIYLQSNGEDGKLDVGDLNSNALTLSIDGFENSTELINVCFGRIWFI